MGILQTDAIVLDQVRSFLSNDFAIHDLTGQPVGRIVTEGGAGSRLLMGNRQLAIVDSDGTLLMRLVDPPNLGLDRFEVLDGHGNLVARIVKEFTLFKKALRIELTTGPQLRLDGSLFDHEFSVTGPGGVAATVSRHWPGVTQVFLGRERYVLGFSPQVPAPEKLGTIGVVIALDLIRAKQRNNG
ncbi:hypothetical protein ON003_09475 [Janibacter hoylei]|uniref:LURP-one-related/scramblase family protein n=1 Tax=Janibacter hoylei TaxID=364298 RepID=UPI0022389B8D|nr:hypothetical protein [Janibacter hoylei]MCW4601803.1 hypothetical protein [Janibacter hoylei]